MNVFYKEYYSKPAISANKYFSTKDWKTFGYNSLEALYRYCGCSQNLDYLKGYYEYEKYPRGTQLITTGIPCNKVFFIISGRIKTTTVDEKGNAYVRCLFNDGNVTTSVENFFDGEETSATVEAISTLRVLELTKENYMKLKSHNDFLIFLIYSFKSGLFFKWNLKKFIFCLPGKK